MTDTDTPNLADLLAIYKDVADAEDSWKARKADLRAQIDAVLRAQYEATGTLPTVRHPDGICTAYLSGGGTTASVIQPETYAHWASERFPEAVTFAVEVPMKIVHTEDFQRINSKLMLMASASSSRVDADLLPALVAGGGLDVDSGQLVTDSGEVVSGVRVSTSSPHLVVKPAKDKGAE